MFFALKILLKRYKNKDTEQSNLNIKCGKPVYVVSFPGIKIMTVVTVIINVIATIYCLGIFYTAVSIKVNIGALINMVTKNDGDVLPTLFALPALLCLKLNIAVIYLLYRAFAPEERKWTNMILFGLVLTYLASLLIILIVCILVLTHVYGSHEKLHDGIIDAMMNYSSDSSIKQKVDLMQIEFQCCGSKKYDEWYDIQWYDPSLIKPG